MKKSGRIVILLIAIILFAMRLCAQQVTNSQLWTDYLFDIPSGKNLFETEFSYQTLLGTKEKIARWYSMNLTPAYERSMNKYVDLISSLGFSYTIQNDTTNSIEVRPMVGARFYLTPEFRLQTRLTFRYEHRLFKETGSSNLQNADRIRFRPELVFPVTKRSYFDDKMLYVLADVEFFVDLGNPIHETFSNQVRNRVGLGYRFNYNVRLEGIYMLQRSKNEIEDDFDTRDNIYRIRMKVYLPFKSPLLLQRKEGDGN